MGLYQLYQEKIVPEWTNKEKTKSPLAVPRVSKVVINVGLKEGKDDKKVLEVVGEQIASITGQKPKVCRAKKSIAGFKLGRNQPIGLMATLRGKRALIFLEKLISIVLPRVRDFNGLKLTGFDGHGNYNMGITEQIVFVEIDFAKIDKSRGIQITIVTNTEDDQKAQRLLKEFGFPFKKD